MSGGDTLAAVAEEVAACRACPRLVTWREEVGRTKRAAYRDEEYWARGVPGFGDPDAWLVLVGLAPGAHGSNRTGRMFTGDRSGDVLYGALHRAGLANRPESVGRDDGLVLTGCFITAAVRCAPPANRPAPDERERCQGFIERELTLLISARVLIALGGFAWDAVLRTLGAPPPRGRFGHGARTSLPGGRVLLGSYHPSQQNVFTGRLTPAMLDDVLAEASRLRSGDGVDRRFE